MSPSSSSRRRGRRTYDLHSLHEGYFAEPGEHIKNPKKKAAAHQRIVAMFAKLQKHAQQIEATAEIQVRRARHRVILACQNAFTVRVLLTRKAKVSMTSESSVETTLRRQYDERRRKGGPLDGEERWAKFDDSVDGTTSWQIVTLYREENGCEPKAQLKLQSAGNSTARS